MSKIATPSLQSDDERLQSKRERFFLWWGIALCPVCALGFWLLIFAMNRYDASYDTASLAAQPLTIAPDFPRRLIDFSLTDQTGRTITRKDLDGKFVVVDFLFTSCSKTCPEVSREMAKIQQLTVGEPDVQLVSLTVDPDDDTVPVLKQYSAGFGADPNRWSFLTGDDSVMHSLIGVSFLAPDTTSQFSYMPGNFAHIERIVLVDPQGHVRQYFNGLKDGAAEGVLEEIRQLKQSPQ